MKHCSRRLMALLLSAILCVQLLPAMVRAEEGTAAASEGKGAFGLPAATGLTEGSVEYNSAVKDAPFGSSGRAVPLFVKSELMLSYSWGGAPLYSHTYDYNGDGSMAGDLMGAFPNLANKYRVTFNSLPASAQASYRVAATDGVNTGSGRQEHIAMIGLSAAGIELSLRDRNNNAVHTSQVSSGDRSWINRLAFELGGFAAIACGDFDGDGVDSVVVYVPPTQGKRDAKLMEYTISSEGSSPTLTEGVEIGNVYDLLGVSTLKADHIQNVPVVQLTAADTDKDGYDELVITAGLNDTNGYPLVQNLGTQVFLYDRLEDGWTQTFKYAPSAGVGTVAVGDVSPASKQHRYVWGSSSVGNVLASDDSSNGTDFPEIVTAGMIDYSGNHNISINNKTCGFSMVRCVGMTEVWTGVQKNFQGQYEFLHRQTHITNTLTTHGLYSGDEVLSPLIVKCFRYQGGRSRMRCSSRAVCTRGRTTTAAAPSPTSTLTVPSITPTNTLDQPRSPTSRCRPWPWATLTATARGASRSSSHRWSSRAAPETITALCIPSATSQRSITAAMSSSTRKRTVGSSTSNLALMCV